MSVMILVFKKCSNYTILQESNSRDTILPRDSTTSFKPLAMDMREERRRIRTLASRKRALGVFGITDTVY